MPRSYDESTLACEISDWVDRVSKGDGKEGIRLIVGRFWGIDVDLGFQSEYEDFSNTEVAFQFDWVASVAP